MLKHIRGSLKNTNFKGRLKVIVQFSYTISTKPVRAPNSRIVALVCGNYRYLMERNALD